MHVTRRFARPILAAAAGALAIAAAAPPATPLVPIENAVRGTPPPAAGAERGARLLLESIKADDPSIAAGFFFPAAAFDLVKAMAVPGRYHRKLVAWYAEDIRAEHARFRDPSWQLQAFALGRCRWQEIGTEGNALPYWSCRGSRVTARSGERTRSFDIHVLINWGASWYVTHLGPIRS
jgi:hypothetical protein